MLPMLPVEPVLWAEIWRTAMNRVQTIAHPE